MADNKLINWDIKLGKGNSRRNVSKDTGKGWKKQEKGMDKIQGQATV
jgi:hypothetical protein